MKLGKGPQVMLEALASGDPEKINEANEFQREAFRAQMGCYPEEMTHACCGQQLKNCACVYGLFEHCKCSEQKD